MTTVDELFAAVESHRFSALVNVASNLKTFLRALAAQPEIQQLAQEMGAPDVLQAVCDRAIDATRSDVDPAFEHPLDAALAAYIWLLASRDTTLATMAAYAVRNCAKVWWSRQVADKLLASKEINLDSASPALVRVPPTQANEPAAGH